MSSLLFSLLVVHITKETNKAASLAIYKSFGARTEKHVSQAGISNYIPQNTVGCDYLTLPEISAYYVRNSRPLYTERRLSGMVPHETSLSRDGVSPLVQNQHIGDLVQDCNNLSFSYLKLTFTLIYESFIIKRYIMSTCIT